MKDSIIMSTVQTKTSSFKCSYLPLTLHVSTTFFISDTTSLSILNCYQTFPARASHFYFTLTSFSVQAWLYEHNPAAEGSSWQPSRSSLLELVPSVEHTVVVCLSCWEYAAFKLCHWWTCSFPRRRLEDLHRPCSSSEGGVPSSYSSAIWYQFDGHFLSFQVCEPPVVS